MDNTEAVSIKEQFETEMQDFFSKANAKVLKLGRDYPFSQYEPNYIILDTQRKSFYFAEVDLSIDSYIAEISSNSTSNDELLSKMVDKFAEDKEIDKNLAFNLLSLGRAFKELPASHFSFPDTDLTIFNRKLSLIVQEPRSVDVIGALNEFGFTHQAVPSKNMKAIFFDDKSAKLVEANYEEYFKLFAPVPEEEDKKDDDGDEIKPVFTPTGDGQPKDPNNHQKEEPVKETTSNEETNELDDTPLNDDEKQMIENINLDDLVKTSEADKLPEDEIEANKLLSKSINDQALANSTNVEIATRDISEVPLEILSSTNSDDDDYEHDNQSSNSKNTADNYKKKESIEDKKAKKLAEKQAAKKAKENAKLEAKKAKEAKKAIALSMAQENNITNPDENSLISLPAKIMDNIIGFIFFSPLYILFKAFRDLAPAYIYYWFFSILTILFAFFGGFDAIASFIPARLTDWKSLNLISTLDSISDTLRSFPNATQEIITLTDNLISEARIVLESEKTTFELIRSVIFQAIVPFGSCIMVIPAFRFIGKALIIFSIMSYMFMGFIPYLQSKFLLYAVRNIEDLTLFPRIIGMTINHIPIIFVLILLIISVAIVPDKAKRSRRVLP